jgi:hypothetical protein
MRAASPPSLPVVLILLVPALAGNSSTRGEVSRPPEGDCALFSLPWSVSEPVYRFAGAVPDAVATFRARNGRDWELYLDPLLGTARYAAPIEPFPLVEAPEGAAELDRAAAAAAVLGFIDSNRDLFGPSADELEALEFQPLGGGLLVLFGQHTRSGVPVRGASLRVHIGADGGLRFVKSFLGRGLSEAWEAAGLESAAFLSPEKAAASAGGAVIDQRLELAFEGGRLDAVVPLWRLFVRADGKDLSEGVARGLVEELRDARSGALLAACPLVKHFDVQGEVLGVTAPLDERTGPFRQPQDIAEGIQQPIEGVLITVSRAGPGDPTPPPLPVALTSADGHFQASVPNTVFEPAQLVGTLATVFALEDLDPCVDQAFLTPCLALSVQAPDENEACVDNDQSVGLCFADEALRQDSALPFVFVFNQGGMRRFPGAIFRSFWLQCFVHGRRVLRWCNERIADAFSVMPEEVRPARLSPLVIQVREPPSALEPGYHPRTDTESAHVTAPLRAFFNDDWRGRPRPPAESFPMMPTMTAHEVAHHVLWELGEVAGTTQVEEGLADALAAMALDDPRVFFTTASQAGPAGYGLDVIPAGGDPNRYISELRAAVASGFWELSQQLQQRGHDGDHAARLLLRFVRANHAREPSMRTYEDPAALLVELMTINDDLNLEFGAMEHRVTTTRLRDSFRHCHFLGGVPFVRGDTNLDSEVDISDAVLTLGYLFNGSAQPHDCRDAMDSDDNGLLELTDAVRILNFLFLDRNLPPAPPFPDCDVDKTRVGDPFCCAEFTCPE